MEWGRLSRLFPGWSLQEIKALSPRERVNWAEVAATIATGG